MEHTNTLFLLLELISEKEESKRICIGKEVSGDAIQQVFPSKSSYHFRYLNCCQILYPYATAACPQTWRLYTVPVLMLRNVSYMHLSICLLLLFQERQKLYHVLFSLASNQNISNIFRQDSSCQNYLTTECFLNLGTRVAGETSRTWDRRCDTQTPPLLFLPDGASQPKFKSSRNIELFLAACHQLTQLLSSLSLLLAILGTARHGTARHSTAQHSTARHSTAQHGTARHGTARHIAAQRSAARHSTAQHGTARYSMSRHVTA